MARMRGSSTRSAVLVALLCVAIPPLWWCLQLSLHSGDRSQWVNREVYSYTVPALRYGGRMLSQGSLPLWNPYQACGTPYLAAKHHGLLYPLNWLVVIFSLTQVFRLSLYAHGVLEMAGAYWCARQFDTGRAAALLAGVGFAFSGTLFNLAVSQLPTMLASVVWIPVQLGLTRAMLARAEGWRWRAAALGGAFALQFVGGHPEYVLMSMQLCGAYLLAHLVWVARRARGRMVARFALAGVVAFGLSAIQLLPTVELMLRSPRRPGAILGANDPWPAWPSVGAPAQQIASPMYFLGLAGDGHVPIAALGLAVVPSFSVGRHARVCFSGRWVCVPRFSHWETLRRSTAGICTCRPPVCFAIRGVSWL